MAVQDRENAGSKDLASSVRRVGPKIVRAWFDTVINPLIEVLANEESLLQSHNWTWRFRPAGLELIRPVEDHLGHAIWANAEQICELYPEIDRRILNHDIAAAELSRAVRDLYNSLLNDRAFESVFNALLEPGSLNELGVNSASELFGAYPNDDWMKLIAQYIVNNTSLLGPHNSTARLWNKHRKQLLSFLESPGIAPIHSDAVNTGDELRNSIGELNRALRSLRRELSLEYDEPPVPAAQR